MKKHAFIFDMDGTLVDNARFHSQVWVDLLMELGVTMDLETFHRSTAGKTNPQILREQLAGRLSDAEIEKLAEDKETLYRQRFRPHLKAIRGLPEFLESAHRQGIAMALATSAGRENMIFTLEGLGLTTRFQTVIDSTQVQYGKPHPEMFLLAAERLGVLPENCIVFEDSPAGIEAARRAGMRAVVITTSLTSEELAGSPAVMLAVPDYSRLEPASLINGRQPPAQA